MTRDRCNCYFLFWAIFCLFTPLITRKIKISKNEKKRKKRNPRDITLHMCTKNYDHILYYSWDMVSDRCNCYFSFSAQKMKISKKWKKKLRDIIILPCVPKIMIRWCSVPEIWCATGGRKKWHIEVGALPNNVSNSNK